MKLIFLSGVIKMDVLKFTETIFSNRKKEGKITPDENGYYTVVLGGLNTYNSAGEYYTAEGALQLFENSSHLMRRIKNGSLYSELGHPKKIPGMSMEDFYNRILTIDETNITGHISEITLDMSFGKKNPEIGNPDLIAIIGKVKPFGPHASTLQAALENPKQNSAFSIRGLTENKYRNGRVERILTNIITWDYVVEPGISIACKAYSPGLEHLQVEEISETIIDKRLLEKVVKNNLSVIATEDNRNMYNEILKSINKINISNKLSQW